MANNPVHPYDNPDKVNKFLTQLTNLDLLKEDFNKLSRDIDTNLGVIPFSGICIKKGTKLYRARKIGVFQKDMFKELKDISIRDKSFIKTFGRANTVDQSVFYCSFTPETAAREVTQWQIDDLGALTRKGVRFHEYNPFTQFMTISTWVLKEDMYFFTAFNEEENAVPTSQVDPVTLHFSKRYQFDLNRFYQSQRMVNKFFSEQFLKSEINSQNDYFYSAYYSNLAYKMTQSGLVGGLIYSSVAYDAEGYNIALPEKLMNAIEFVSAEHCYTFNAKDKPNFTNQKVVIAPISRATLLTNNNLEWSEIAWENDTMNGVCRIKVQP